SRRGEKFLCQRSIQRTLGYRPISQPACFVCPSLARRALWPWLGSRFRRRLRSDRPMLSHRRGHGHARFPALLPHASSWCATLHLHAPALHLHYFAPGRHHLARHLLFPRRAPPPQPLIYLWNLSECRCYSGGHNFSRAKNAPNQSSFIGPCTYNNALACHSERSEESAFPSLRAVSNQFSHRL